MTRVMAFGTFDQFHPGHLYFLQQAKRHGDELVVVVARDQTVQAVKGRQARQAEDQRLAQLQLVDCVDKAVLGNPGDKYQVVRQFKPAVICLGYDQRAFTDELPLHFPQVKIVRLPAFHPERYHTSTLDTCNIPSTKNFEKYQTPITKSQTLMNDQNLNSQNRLEFQDLNF